MRHLNVCRIGTAWLFYLKSLAIQMFGMDGSFFVSKQKSFGSGEKNEIRHYNKIRIWLFIWNDTHPHTSFIRFASWCIQIWSFESLEWVNLLGNHEVQLSLAERDILQDKLRFHVKLKVLKLFVHLFSSPFVRRVLN